jgi:shikimate kinase
MKNIPSYFLVGPMGAGKSTIGRLLSEELQLAFIDSDREIEEKAGASIPWIFDVEGESGFRERETAAIDELTQQSGLVLATGGGAVIRPENRRFLRSRGIVVYLQTSVETQLERTSKDKNRPLLQQNDPRQVLTDLLNIRHPHYVEIADITAETDTLTPKAVVALILEKSASL